jgi:hypothetical protein
MSCGHPRHNAAKPSWEMIRTRKNLRSNKYVTGVNYYVCVYRSVCCTLRGPGEEHVVDVVPRGTELQLHVKTGSLGRLHTLAIFPTSSVLVFIVHKQWIMLLQVKCMEFYSRDCWSLHYYTHWPSRFVQSCWSPFEILLQTNKSTRQLLLHSIPHIACTTNP